MGNGCAPEAPCTERSVGTTWPTLPSCAPRRRRSGWCPGTRPFPGWSMRCDRDGLGAGAAAGRNDRPPTTTWVPPRCWSSTWTPPRRRPQQEGVRSTDARARIRVPPAVDLPRPLRRAGTGCRWRFGWGRSTPARTPSSTHGGRRGCL